MNLWPVEHFFHHKRVPVKRSTGQRLPEVHLSKVTSYKIHIKKDHYSQSYKITNFYFYLFHGMMEWHGLDGT